MAKFKVGDKVRCMNPTHCGTNPFVIESFQLTMCSTDNDEVEMAYYSDDGSDSDHNYGRVGCRESELELVTT